MELFHYDITTMEDWSWSPYSYCYDSSQHENNNRNASSSSGVSLSSNHRFYTSIVPQQQRKRVRFHNACVVSYIPAGSNMTREERDLLWYPTADLDGFKVQARNMCRKLRDHPEGHNTPSSPRHEQQQQQTAEDVPRRKGSSTPPPPLLLHPPPTAEASCGTGEEEENAQGSAISSCTLQRHRKDDCDSHNTRGLEHRVCLNRQRHKHLAIRCTLKAQSQSRCPDFLARISSQCTQWARDIAVQEGNRDYGEVYCPQKLKPRKLTNESPFRALAKLHQKRCYEDKCAADEMDQQGISSWSRTEGKSPPILDLDSLRFAPCPPLPVQHQPSMQAAQAMVNLASPDRCVRQKLEDA